MIDMPGRSALPTSADVVVVGAGLAGLITARSLRAAGADVVVLEAQDRIGGRIERRISDSGTAYEAGGEYLGIHMRQITRLAAELGIDVVPVHADGAVVHFLGGERAVEAFPFENDAEALAGCAAATQALDELARTVPVDAPWAAPHAAELDARTLGSWINDHVPDERVRRVLSLEFDYTGQNPAELSLLFALWLVHSMGGWDRWSEGTSHMLRGGTSQLVTRVAAELEGCIHTDAPVRAIQHGPAGVTLRSDRGQVRATVVVVAMAPQLCARIAWEPRLPVARDRLQDRYLQGHGIKVLATYERSWWRDEGLSGLGLGLSPFFVVLDSTGPDDPGGRLTGMAAYTGTVAAKHGGRMSDDRAAKELFLELAERYLGPRVREAGELHVSNWAGDPWSLGCGVGLPTGVLSSVGHALRTPIGPIVWAGAETGLPQVDWIEGAISSGHRAADEALARLATS